MRRIVSNLLAIAAFAALLTLACSGGDGRPEIWIYTSIYPHVIEAMKPSLEREFPEANIRWYQKGSELVAARVATELEAGGRSCDLLMISDPFFYDRLHGEGRLTAHAGERAATVAAEFRGPDDAYVTVRVPLMVMAVNTEQLPEEQWPTSFADLDQARYRGQIAMGDPLKSGTTFTTVAALGRKYGWEYFERLRANEVLSAGGNGTVLSRLETGERKIGILLLENLLPAIERGAPLRVIYPQDGAIPVPSPVAILASSQQPELARRIHDFLFSDEQQAAIRAGFMYSPLADQAAPTGAKPWNELSLYPWDAEFQSWAREERANIKVRFQSIFGS